MSPQEKRHGVMARIRISDLTVERPTLYHLSYPARQGEADALPLELSGQTKIALKKTIYNKKKPR
jgi:hypothetical protein